MENHPIPQDVTGFQFKLIGSMTVKQFGMLAVPVVSAFLLYYFPIPVFIKLPLMFLLGLIGLVLAFIPIEGRPADVMIRHFIEAFFAPTQYLYTKEGRALAFATVNLQANRPQSHAPHRDNKKDLQLQQYLQDTHISNPLDDKETAFLQLLQKYSPTPQPAPTHQANSFSLPLHMPKFNIGKTTDVVVPPSAAAQPQTQAVTPIQPTQTPQPQTVQQPTPVVVHSEPIMPTPFKPAVSSAPSVTQNATIPPAPVMMQATHPDVAIPTPTPAAKPAIPDNEEFINQLQKTQEENMKLEERLQKEKDEKKKMTEELEKLRQQHAASTPTPAPKVEPVAPVVVTAPPPPVEQPKPEPQKPVEPVVAAPPAPTTPPPSTNAQSQAGTMPAGTPHVSKIPREMAQSLGLPTVPDSPNLITGLIRDPRGNVLPNVLVEVKDKEGNPVRAFKTNQLGQFASATPLLNGTYTITFEDPADQQKFDMIEIHAKGEIISPISIVSHDAREELRKALFN